ncbi:hypothetical protein OG936_38510 (plasmid) [Streptomyces sp. NBC_00846]|uniref:hypothetical protein n=1 Tax=Streptomyces sp. NBC_00846 TaxID=2975849 RepID=UPI002F90EE00|nr:hypothetical protein OG936_38510 [Streptomyces sp. NBC_00846]
MAAAEDPVPGGRGRILPPAAGLERGRRASPTFRWEYSVGWYLTEREQATIEIVDRKKLWQPTTGEGGHVREDAFVADITGLLADITGWPKSHRVIARRSRCAPAASRTPPTTRSSNRSATGPSPPTVAAVRSPTSTPGTASTPASSRDSKASGMGLLPSHETNVNAA